MSEPYPIPRDLADLPHRITVRCVLALAGYSRTTLMARIESGAMPAPVDRGKGGMIFVRDDVLRALGLKVPGEPEKPIAEVEQTDAWDFKSGALNASLERSRREKVLLSRGVKRGSREWYSQLAGWPEKD